MQSSSCSTAHANNLINRVPRVQFSISFNIYVYNQCLCVIPNFWSVPLFFIIIIIIQRLNPPLLAYCTSTWMREGDTLCKCRCRPGQLESMMLRPHRGTASFCVDFGVKKGVKVPPSGRYDLFVPWTPGFPCVFRYQHFEEFYAWLTRVHKKKKKKDTRNHAQLLLVVERVHNFFISTSNIIYVVVRKYKRRPLFSRSFITRPTSGRYFLFFFIFS